MPATHMYTLTGACELPYFAGPSNFVPSARRPPTTRGLPGAQAKVSACFDSPSHSRETGLSDQCFILGTGFWNSVLRGRAGTEAPPAAQSQATRAFFSDSYWSANYE